MDFPGGSVVKNLPANVGERGLILGSGKIPWKRKWQPTLVLLPGKTHRPRSLASYSTWGHKRVGHDLETNQQQQWLINDSVGQQFKLGSVDSSMSLRWVHISFYGFPPVLEANNASHLWLLARRKGQFCVSHHPSQSPTSFVWLMSGFQGEWERASFNMQALIRPLPASGLLLSPKVT